MFDDDYENSIHYSLHCFAFTSERNYFYKLTDLQTLLNGIKDLSIYVDQQRLDKVTVHWIPKQTLPLNRITSVQISHSIVDEL